MNSIFCPSLSQIQNFFTLSNRADDYAKCGDKLRYGQAFCLQTAAPEAGEVCLIYKKTFKHMTVKN